MINYMSKSPGIAARDLSSLRAVLCAAAPMPLRADRGPAAATGGSATPSRTA